MDVELINYMGSDELVVNAARVSFKKEVEFFGDKDIRLIHYLAAHNHWTPFSHVMVTMREKVPVFVARQRFKHTVGFTYNEVSRRYVDDKPEFFYPDGWRKKAENKKQGSSDEVVNPNLLHIEFMESYDDYFGGSYEEVLYLCTKWYDNAIEAGVAPEQARMVLPQSMYTEYYVTGSLAAWARAYKLRSEESSQQEIRELAEMWYNKLSGITEIEHSWKALIK